ncbi:MAG TPA: HAMP domain-containing sensor histidine kinase [Acidimicrobiales bacterium]|nr:HAMP domain-containing sensor histidine kinase [Acidimicrobiales bacterium]
MMAQQFDPDDHGGKEAATETSARPNRKGPWFALVVGGLIAALSVVAALLLGHSVSDQNRAQLQSEAQQLTSLASSYLTSAGPQLQTLDAVAHATNDSPTTFVSEVRSLFGPTTPNVAVVRGGRIVLASGSGLHTGQPLPAPLAHAVAGTHVGLFSPGVVTTDNKQELVLAVGSGTPGNVVLEEGAVDPSKPIHLTGQLGFRDLNVAIYASPVARPDQLVITTAPLPFSGTTAKTFVPVGNASKWLVVTGASTALAGAWPNAFPWILLVSGLMLAIVLGVLVSVLGRRERYAQQLVAARTAELESIQEEVVRKERLSAVGEMATMIGHELRNPLGAAINGIYLARRHLGDQITPPVEHDLDLIERQTQRAAVLAEDLTAYMRERRPDLEHIEFGDVLDRVLEATPAPEGFEVRVEGRRVGVDADIAQLIQMLSNVVSNAYQAMPEGGSVHVGATSDDGSVEIVVSDNGPGLGPAAQVRAFDPFFTTKAQGTGLGLSIVQRLAEAHGGSVALENQEGGGARVVIRLPETDVSAKAQR